MVTEAPATEAPATSMDVPSSEPSAPGSTDVPVDSSATTEPETTDGGPVIFLTPDPTNTITIDKTNTADGEPARDGTSAQPGDSWTYNLLASCSNINVDCVNLTVVDTFPADVIVDESSFAGTNATCADVAGLRDVTYDASTRTLTIVYIEPLANPPGALGKIAGTSNSCRVRVTLPATTPLEDGTVIPNEATVSADNVAASATDPSDVTVDIPVVLDVGATKSFTDPSAIAGDPNATTTMQLGGINQSSNSAEVTEMTIEDSTPATFEYLDFTGATVTAFPTGADQAQLYVCPAPGPCTSDADWVAGGTASPPAPAALSPAPTAPGDVVGVRVVFTAPDGGFIENEAGGGTAGVDIDMHLRTTVRSTGQLITQIPSTTIVNNQTTATVTDDDPDTPPANDTDQAQYQILPPTLEITPTKTFFADGNGNYQTDGGEHAVIGENSGVSMLINATNASAFPISEITIIEPGAEPPPNEFQKFDASSIRLTFPAGAANAHVVITYDAGPPTVADYPAPGPTTIDVTPPPRVTSITVTYTGDPAVDGGNTIQPGATAGLGVHGNLNELVDGSDVGGGGVVAGIDNCADVVAEGTPYPGGTGTAVGTACASLPVEARNGDTGGTKVPSQGEVPADQAVLFTLTTTNNGNLPLIDLIVADPPTSTPGGAPPAADVNSVWYWGMFVGADVQPAAMAGRVTIEIYVPGQGWQPLPPDSPPTGEGGPYPEVTGVRGSIDVLNPTESFSLRVGMTSRIPQPDGTPPPTLTNCYGVTADTENGFGGDYTAESYCSTPITPGPVVESAAINKAITPETMPFRIPGMTPQSATVTLQIRNTGTITARTLQLTDNDSDFWDAVDFAGFSSIQAPAVGELRDADRIQIDAYVDADGDGPAAGAWVDGTPTTIGSPTLPSGVTAAQVRGLRFTFSDTSTLYDGFVLTPCAGADPTCAGVVEFLVQPRLTLVSTGQPIPDTDACPAPDPAPTGCAELLDSATGAFTTRLHPAGSTIPEVTDDLIFVPGTPALDVGKIPENATVEPGQLASFSLGTRNSGTANLPDVTVSDPLPEGILFDDTFADPVTGLPYNVTWANLPSGYPAPPDAVFETTADPADPTRIGLLRWTFPGWDMPPNATVTILFRYTLEPGVTAGQQIVNTMGASSPVDGLECSDPNDGQVTDGDFGAGLYCTDPANVTVTAGASFASRKWVAGNPSLGWYNVLTGEAVPIGSPECLSLQANGRTYTTNPCIALVNPGEPFFYVLRVQNAGTEPALTMTIVDKFPAPGDTGVAGADRGTEWATAPTLAGPATYNGLPAGEIQYTTGEPCAAGLSAWPCNDVTWSGTAAGSTALRMLATFDPTPLPPGGTVDVYFTMNTPVEVPRVSDPTIAWNSIAHSETTRINNGGVRELAPLEPLKVGVATMYGNLQVIKEIGFNPADVPLDDVEFTFSYDCTISTGVPGPVGTVTATPTTPGAVTGIPSGSTCTVTETDTHGAIPSPDPAVVVIEPSTDPDTPVVSSVTITNDLPLGEFELLKEVTGFDDLDYVGGPYPVTVDCTFAGVDVPGFPTDLELTPGGAETVEAPIGSVCTVTETDDNGATTVTYDPANADGTAGEITVPSEIQAAVTLTITNDFPYGAISLLKEVTGDVIPPFWDPDFTGEPFVASVDCTWEGTSVPGYPVVVELLPDEESEPLVAPVGSVCTVTENDDRGATTVTYDPANDDGTAGEVTVLEGSDADPVSITITNDYPDGGLELIKAIGDNEADLELDDIEYIFAYQCRFDPDGDPQTPDEIVYPDPEVELVVTVNEPAEVTGLPADSVCQVWETDANGGISDHGPDNPAEVTIVEGTILRPLTPVTITNDYPTGRGELVKLIAGDVQDEFVPGPYLIHVDCWGPDQEPGSPNSFEGFPVDVEVFPNEPVGTDLPVGTTCWFQEDASNIPDGATVTYDPANEDGTSGAVVVPPNPPVEGFFGSVTVTNTYTTGSLVIEKTVSGPGAPEFSQGPFVFDVTCSYQGVEDVYSTTVTIPGSPDGTPVQSDPVTGLPIGAECTVTEVDSGGADIVTSPQSVTIAENEQQNVNFVGVDNPFSAGTISVAKIVDGSAADVADPDNIPDLVYTIGVECAVEETDGSITTLLDTTVDVPGDGAPVPVPDPATGEPALLPLGTRCWGSEAASFGATTVTIDHDSYDNGVAVVADAAGGSQDLLITVTNTYEAAQLTVTKAVVNEPDPNATYTFGVACTITDTDGTVIDVPLLTGTSPFTLGGDESATFDILVGSTCTVRETTSPTGATITYAESGGAAGGASGDGVVIVGPDAIVTVTNEFPAEVSPDDDELPSSA